MTGNPDITAMLRDWSRGDIEAFPRLMELAYDDLRAIAHRRLRLGDRSDSLATTALVNEAYLKLAGHAKGTWESRAHFYAFASRAMRHILVDHVRRTRATKRGGDLIRIPLDEELAPGRDAGADLLGIDEALDQLAARHPRMGQVVELRFFGGLSVAEVAQVLDTSVRTVEREWTRARAHLLEMIAGDEDP